MEFILEFLGEIFVECFVEGIMEAAQNRKRPRWQRLVFLGILTAFYGALMALFIWIAVECDNLAVKGMMVGIALLCLMLLGKAWRRCVKG